MYPLPLALLLCAVAPYWWPVAAIAAAIRLLSARVTCSNVLRARLNWPMLVLEDILGFLFWFAGFFGNSVTWRGRTYKMDRQGRVTD
jgi:ceramide glucosyltransferase